MTGLLVVVAFAIKRHYANVTLQLRRLDSIVAATEVETTDRVPALEPPARNARTAVILVNGYNGLGLHTCLHVPRMFGDSFRIGITTESSGLIRRYIVRDSFQG